MLKTIFICLLHVLISGEVLAQGDAGVLYTTATHYFSRLRPLVYSPESPIDTRTSPNSRNSFFAGHVALVGTGPGSISLRISCWARRSVPCRDC